MLPIDALLFDLDGTLIDSRKDVQRAVPGLEGEALLKGVERFKADYRDHCLDHTRLYAGVGDVLEHFAGKKLAVVTNKPARISRQILAGLGIADRLGAIVGGDTLPDKKPSPLPIRHAMEQLAVSDPRRVIMIGDGPNDVLSARAAGAWACGVVSNMGDPERLAAARPDWLIQDLRELPKQFDGPFPPPKSDLS
jgi:phosphoglycolate phosphatase